MNRKTLLVSAGLLAIAGGLVTAPVASATAPPPTLRVGPSTVLAGQTVKFSAYCAGNASEVTSPGLAAPVSLSKGFGYGRAGARPGHYTASFTCSGSGGPVGNGTATAEFAVVCSVPTTKPTTPTSTPTTPQESTTSAPPTSTTEPTTTAETRCVTATSPARPRR
ncbi:hypothetical protein LWP59_19735 [Amycolatopsis acidiphila]|uniref:hypothetical protein n=1 Tax=Amycolatopsis acidiphila TaxID=715473 RepID=UPI001643C878|nr:hypothetical protein [Amycolatopsis acidiphila]UIJ63703.1 hypothetical protein LWP59_19735 [Amycolatopsis acidiphila]GHG67352.1 hypothetical protein GCM10017788_26180 [Amycolatopsis acidiphila]